MSVLIADNQAVIWAACLVVLFLTIALVIVRRRRSLPPKPFNVPIPTKRVARFDPKTGKLIPLNEPNMSLAVLLFEALDDEQEDQIFASGIGAEVIRYVTTVPDIRVNSRPTSFSFRSGVSDIRQVAEQLNVRYVLAGSVKRNDAQMTVNAQLNDIETGGQIWSQTYNQPLATMFDVQRDIARRIVGAVLGEVKLSETLFAESSPMHQLNVWGLINKAYYFWLTTFTAEAILEACDYLRQAIDLQPNNAHARAALAMLLAQQMTTRICKDYDLCAEAASELIETAVDQAPDDVEVLENAGVTWQNLGEKERAQAALRRAVELAPLNLIARGYLALLLSFTAGDEGANEAREIIEDNFATAPKHPSAPYWNYFLAVAEQRLGNNRAAINLVQQSLQGQPGWIHSYFLLANAQFVEGNQEEANATLLKAANLSPYLNPLLYAENVKRIVGSRSGSTPFIQGFEAQGLLVSKDEELVRKR